MLLGSPTARGRPLQIEITGGKAHDIGAPDILLEDINMDAVIADKAYDSNDIVHLIEEQGATSLYKTLTPIAY